MLLVLVDGMVIEDGQLTPPAVGEVITLALSFCEVVDDGGDDASVVALSANAEPMGDGSPVIGSSTCGGPPDRPPLWFTMLHGDGWTASWSAPRPVVGSALLTGRLVGDFGAVAHGRVRGRVTAASVLSELMVPEPKEHGIRLRRTPGEQRLRPVAVAPRTFDCERLHAGDSGPARIELGVLVELDVDDVSPG